LESFVFVEFGKQKAENVSFTRSLNENKIYIFFLKAGKLQTMFTGILNIISSFSFKRI